MRRALRAYLFILLLGCAGWCLGAEVPKLTGRIVDTAGTLTQLEKRRVETALAAFNHSTGGQLAILVEEHIPEGESLEGWTLKVAETWALGLKGQDNGALLYLAMKDRRNRLEVGYGWEGAINDARAGDVLRAMAPALSAGETDTAILYAIQQLHIFITGKPLEQLPHLPRSSTTQDGAPSPLFTFLIGIGLVFLFIRYPWLLLLFLNTNSRGRGGFGGSSGGFGGFGGGGGTFGGGGASGRW